MSRMSSFLCVDQPCNQALEWVTRSLSGEGLRILPTFDLHNARISLEDCPCPQHGSQDCDCQMVVLLVYGESGQPATLVLHGSGGQTWLSLVNTPLQHAGEQLRSTVELALKHNPLE